MYIHCSYIIQISNNGWYDWIRWHSNRKYKSRQCYLTWIWMHLSVIDNLTPMGQINSRRVRKRDHFFFIKIQILLKITFIKKSTNLYYKVHRLIVECYLGQLLQQEILSTSVLLRVIYFCRFYLLLFHYEYENCQLA